MSGAIPPNINLAKFKPDAVKSYSRRFKSIATNNQSFDQQSYVNITLDTSTPGSFIDPLQSYLKFDLSFLNCNPFIDYVDMGVGGANAIIQEFRIYCQGTPIEEILNYNLVYRVVCDMGGINKKPYYMFKKNLLKQPVKEIHSVNAIKPPMVNMAGNPMWYQSLYSSSVQASYMSAAYGSNSNGPVLVGTSSAYSNMFTYASGVDAGFVSTTTKSYLQNNYLNDNDYQNTKNMANVSSTLPLLGINSFAPKNAITSQQTLGFTALNSSGGVPTATYTNPVASIAGFPGCEQTAGSSVVSMGNNFTPIELTYTAPPDSNGIYNTYLFQGFPAMLNVLGSCVMTLPGLNGVPISSNSLNGGNAANSLNIDTHPSNPLNWPFFMPNMQAYNHTNESCTNIQDYFMYLSNVKHIPVGLPGQSRPEVGSNIGTEYKDANFPYNSANFKNVPEYMVPTQSKLSSTYTCCLPLLSGILGCLAEKCLPTMLISPGTFFIQLRLAQNKVAFQVSMDPCRRLLGTIRDYVPFGGSLNGLFGQGNYNSMTSVISSQATPTAILPDNINPMATMALSTNENVQPPVPNTNPYQVPNVPSSSVHMGLNSTAPPTTSTTFGDNPTPLTNPQVQGNSCVASLTGGSTTTYSTYTPIVGDGSALVYAMCGITFTGERGYAAKMQCPVLGGYNNLLGANLVSASNLGKSIKYNQSNGGQVDFSSLMFLPYSPLAMEGAWTTLSVKESQYYSSQDKYKNPTSNQSCYSQGVDNVLGDSPLVGTTSATNQTSSVSNPNPTFNLTFAANGGKFSSAGGSTSNGNLFGGGIMVPTANTDPIVVSFVPYVTPSSNPTPLSFLYNQIAKIQGSLTLACLYVNNAVNFAAYPNSFASSTPSSDQLLATSFLAGYTDNNAAAYIAKVSGLLYIINSKTGQPATIGPYSLFTAIDNTAGGVLKSIQDLPFVWDSSTLISNGTINNTILPNGYSLKIQLTITPSNAAAAFIFSPSVHQLDYAVNGGGAVIALPGSTLQIGMDNYPSIAQTTSYPACDVITTSQPGAYQTTQEPYFPFQAGYNTNISWINTQTNGQNNAQPYIPCPSLVENIAINDSLTGGVGRALLTKTELVAHPAGIPMPQYVLASEPYKYKELKAQINNTGIVVVGTNILSSSAIVPEWAACYGSFLEHSRAQSLRCINNSGSRGAANGSQELSYQIANVEFVGQQIIVPDAVSNTILQMATHSEIALQTTSIHCYQTGVQQGGTQNLLIPAKIASANELICVFQPQNYINDTDSQLYDSFSRLCPFSSIKVPGNAWSTSETASSANGIGTETPFVVKNVSAAAGSFEIQLRIGNEQLPQQPITSISEIIAENMKCGHKLFDTSADINAEFVLTTISGSSPSNNTSNGGLYYDCLADNTFCTAFSHVSLLDDQTYINNPNMGYVASLKSKLDGNPSYSARDLWGKRGTYILPFFQPLTSTFWTGFDLDTWSGVSDVAKSGRFLGNNTITLYMTGCDQFNGYTDSGISNIQMFTIIMHDQKISFQAGGSMVAFF